jgi:hypothetical protein
VVRYHALLALRQSLNTARRAVPDPQARDLVKQLRSALNDKSLVVQRAACDVCQSNSSLDRYLIFCRFSWSCTQPKTPRGAQARLSPSSLVAPEHWMPQIFLLGERMLDLLVISWRLLNVYISFLSRIHQRRPRKRTNQRPTMTTPVQSKQQKSQRL